jgi:hypothetical protein
MAYIRSQLMIRWSLYYELEKKVEQAVNITEALSQHFPGGTEKNHKLQIGSL